MSGGILSIDIGSRNMGVCILADDSRIVAWKLVDLPHPLTLQGVCDALQDIAENYWFETVVIERQPGKSLLMQRIQYYCEMFFHLRKKKVILMEARTKLMYASKTPWWPQSIEITKKWSYYTRKKAANLTVSAFLKSTNSTFSTFFHSSPKRDDLADALLQGMACLHNNNVDIPKCSIPSQVDG